MIEVSGFKAFHGEIMVSLKDREPYLIKDKDFLFNPTTNCWHTNGENYPKECVTILEYPIHETCQSHAPLVMDSYGDVLDPCLFETLEKHPNVTVEVLKCKKCGNIEIAWYNDDSDEGEFT